MEQVLSMDILEQYLLQYGDFKVNHLADKKPKWKNEKWFSECTATEKKQANLRQILYDEIVLDVDNGNEQEVENKIQQLQLHYKKYKTGSKGYHFHLFFNKMHKLDKNERNDIRKKVIKFFDCDMAKGSEDTYIAVEDRPHFKTGKPKTLEIDEDGLNNLERLYDMPFSKVEDPVLNYVLNNEIPEGTERDVTLFKNLAILLVQSHLTDIEIDQYVEKIVANCPGKYKGEFKGWIEKAKQGKLTTYNKKEMNAWINKHDLNIDFYDDVTEQPYFEVLTYGQLSNIEIKPVQWIAQDLVPEKSVTVWMGKSGAFKTWSALHMAIAIASGSDFMDIFKTSSVPVLYIDEEDGQNRTVERIKKIVNGMDIDENKLNINFMLMSDKGFKFNEKTVSLLMNVIKNKSIKVVIIDTLRRVMTGDENSSMDVNTFFEHIKKIRTSCDVSFVILHHMSKGLRGQVSIDQLDQLRGSGDIAASAHVVLYNARVRSQNNNFTFHQLKNKQMPEIDPLKINIKQMDDSFSFNCIGSTPKTQIAEDLAAHKITTWINEKGVKEFKRKEMFDSLVNDESEETLKKGLTKLVNSGELERIKQGYYRKPTSLEKFSDNGGIGSIGSATIIPKNPKSKG